MIRHHDVQLMWCALVTEGYRRRLDATAGKGMAAQIPRPPNEPPPDIPPPLDPTRLPGDIPVEDPFDRPPEVPVDDPDESPVPEQENRRRR